MAPNRQQTPNILDDLMSAAPAGAVKPAATALRIAEIRRDGGTQPRAGLDEAHVVDLVAAIAAGDELPPVDVVFDGTAYWLYDGFHRVEATSRSGKYTVQAIIHQGTQADAQWLSYSVNRGHGLKRTNEDKKRAVLAALKHQNAATLSNVQIAKHCGVDEGTIRNYRNQMEVSSEIPKMEERTVSRGGTTYTQNTAKIGTNQPRPQPKRDDAAEDAWRPPGIGARTNGNQAWHTPPPTHAYQPPPATPAPILEVMDSGLAAEASRAYCADTIGKGVIKRPFAYGGMWWITLSVGYKVEFVEYECLRVQPTSEEVLPGVRNPTFLEGAYRAGTVIKGDGKEWQLGAQWLFVRTQKSSGKPLMQVIKTDEEEEQDAQAADIASRNAAADEAARQAQAAAAADVAFGMAPPRHAELVRILDAAMEALPEIGDLITQRQYCLSVVTTLGIMRKELLRAVAEADATSAPVLPTYLADAGWQLHQLRGKWFADVRVPTEQEPIKTQLRADVADTIRDAQYLHKSLRIGA